MVRKLLAAALLLCASAATGLAQQTGGAEVFQTWAPLGRLASPMAVTSTTSNVALPTTGVSVKLCNTGLADAYVAFGTSNAVTVTTANGFLLQTGTCAGYAKNPYATRYTYVAAITASSTTTIYVETGVGTVASRGRTGGSAVTPGGSTGQVQYNNGGAFGGISGATSDGTTLTLVAPVLGTPASVTLTNGTGLPVGGLTGLGSGVAAWLGTPSCTNLATAVTGETGTGACVFATSPTLVTPVLGVASGTSLALGGCTIGANAFCMTGTTAFGGAISATTNNAYDIGASGTSFKSIFATTVISSGATIGVAGLVVTNNALAMGWGDVFLFRDAANTLAQRNGTTAQTFNVYNTYTDASNYERTGLQWTGNIFYVGASAAGTGTRRTVGISGQTIQLISGSGSGSIAWTVGATGSLSNSGISLGDQAQVFAITATQPASPTGTQYATLFTVTGAGSASQTSAAQGIFYNAGYTGSGSTIAAYYQNSNAGTAATLIPATGTNSVLGNTGAYGLVNSTTTGLNTGTIGAASGGNTNAGLVGLAQNAKNSATNIGVVGSAINTGTSPFMIGGFFSLNQTTVPAVSAALIADNGAQAQPIMLLRDNGTTVFTVADGGAVTVANAVQGNTFQAVTNGYYFGAFTSTHMTAPSNGLLLLTNASDNDFSRLQLGGTTSSFPAIKRSTTSIQARLADDSAFTNIQGKLTTDTNFTATPVVATGYMTLYDTTGTAYKVPACLASGC